MPVKLYHGDCLDVLKTLPDNSIDAIVTDPPYLISFMKQKWDIVTSNDAMEEFHFKWASEVLRVLRPGSHILAFSATRTYHRMATAIEDAGFEIRDQLCWLYAQGMPHGLDISKTMDKHFGKDKERKVIGTKVNTYDGSTRDPSKHGNPADQSNIGKWGLTKTPHGMPLTEAVTDEAKKWTGWNTALKPSMESILLARKPLEGTFVENILEHGLGGINIDGCRIPIDPEIDDPRLGGKGTWSTEKAAKTVYEGGYAGERVTSSPLGRYPSNTLWDGSSEVKEVFDSFGEKASGVPGKRRKQRETVSMRELATLDRNETGYGDKGGVHRFFKACEFNDEERRIFYCAKVSPKERNGSKHPCLKPISLLKYLVKLITPLGGTILDPFAGTGTTGLAAAEQGFSAILIEQEEEYIQDAERKLGLYLEDSLINF